MTQDAAKVPIKASRLIGTWRLVGGTAVDADGRSLPPPYGPEPMGLITLTAGGRMMVMSGDGRPALPDGRPRDFGSYCGSYGFDGATLIVTVDGSSSPRIALGSRQIRGVRFEGEVMVLSPPPAIVDDVMQRRELFWERLSSSSA